jgi:hypothetical protein
MDLCGWGGRNGERETPTQLKNLDTLLPGEPLRRTHTLYLLTSVSGRYSLVFYLYCAVAVMSCFQHHELGHVSWEATSTPREEYQQVKIHCIYLG